MKMGNYTRPSQALQRHKISVYSKVMNPSSLFEQIQECAPHLPASLLQDFLAQMDPDYFDQFSLETILQHLELTHQLTFASPCAVTIHTHSPRQYHIHLVAYDYFSGFATFCGVLSSFGLDIREAAIFTSREAPTPSPRPLQIPKNRSSLNRLPPRAPSRGLSRKIAVDVFHVQALKGFSFGPSVQQDFQETLISLLGLLQKNQVRQARRQVNRRLVENLGKTQRKTGDFLHPVRITFSNTASSPDTVLDIRSTDTPAFLYAFANALAMRGIYLVKAKIEVKEHQVLNRLYVRGRQGGKLQSQSEQQELRTAAALLKEFTYYLSSAPDPGKALDHFDQFLDQLLEQPQKASTLSTLTQASTLEHLAQLFGSSDYLWEDLLRRQHDNLLPMMRHYQKGPLVRSKSILKKTIEKKLQLAKSISQKKQNLNQCKDEELFRIDMRHLLENSSLPDFSHALTNLADVILGQALEQSYRSIKPKASPTAPPPMAIFGLGKLGGGELGYASDIEILFVYESLQESGKSQSSKAAADFYERWAQEFLQWIEAKQEGIFHVDTRLRPYGDKGTLASSRDEIQQYYQSQGPAAPFERQAFIKLRFVAGNRTLGKAVEAHRNRFVYGPEPWDLQTALHLRQRQMTELVQPGTRHVKYGPGGLLDVEYMVQYLQLIHGHHHPSLRTPNTLEAIEQLCDESIITLAERETLQDDYLFLRELIDSLRIVRGNAKDLVLPPSGSDEMVFLARRLGMGSTDWQKSAKMFEESTLQRMTHIHKRFRKRFSQKNA
jgi:[glutamine synthetase] adenylyltransferase / [glutamine synthetase]-adenylyl-L-tyrosine phosphorylase